MSSEHPAVQGLLEALTIKINDSTAKLDAQAIGMALSGLQNMSSESSAVQELLNALTSKINGSTVELDAQAIGVALSGLQNMSSAHPAVQKILKALENKFLQSNIKEIEHNFGCQTLASYIQIWRKSPQVNIHKITPKLLDSLNDGKEISNLATLEKCFFDKIKNTHYLKNNSNNNSKLDLHELDHLSMKIIMSDICQKQNMPDLIIFGKGTHSKHTQNIASKIVFDELKKHDLDKKYTFTADDGRITIKPKNLNASMSLKNSPTSKNENEWTEVVKKPARSKKKTTTRTYSYRH